MGTKGNRTNKKKCRDDPRSVEDDCIVHEETNPRQRRRMSPHT